MFGQAQKVSTLTILGKNAVFHPICEMPIIDETGAFRLARGVVQAKTPFFNLTSGDVIVEYHVVAIRYRALIMESIFYFKGPHSACSFQ